MCIPGAQESVQLSRLLSTLPSLCENAVNSGLTWSFSRAVWHGYFVTRKSLSSDFITDITKRSNGRIRTSVSCTPSFLIATHTAAGSRCSNLYDPVQSIGEEREERLREKYHHAIRGRKGGSICLQIFPHHHSNSHSWNWWSVFWIRCLHAPSSPPQQFLLSPPHRVGMRENG